MFLRSVSLTMGILSILAVPCLATTEPALLVHIERYDGTFCAAIDPDTLSCDNIEIEGNGSYMQLVCVLSAGVDSLTAVEFGIAYDSSISILTWIDCLSAQSVTEGSWPDSGSSIALAFDMETPASADSMIVLGTFLLASNSSGTLALTGHAATGAASYVFGENLTGTYDAARLGIVDADGNGEGFNGCEGEPEGSTGGGSSGGSSGGGHIGGDPVARALFAPGVVQLPAGRDTSAVGDATFGSAAVESILVEYNTLSIARTYPGFQLADTLGTSRTGETVRLINRSNYFDIELPDSTSTDSLVSALGMCSDVHLVYSLLHDVNGGPLTEGITDLNDPLFPDQWYLYNTGQVVSGPPFNFSGTDDVDIDAPAAWLMSTGSDDVLVTVFDQGIDTDLHEELVGRTTGDARVCPDCFHGYEVSGVLAANANNSKGIAGVDWHASILSKDYATSATRGVKIHEAIDAGSQIANVSYESSHEFAQRGAWRDAYMMGTLVVSGTGNDGCSDPHHFPGQFSAPGVLTVGGIDFNNQYETPPGWPSPCIRPSSSPFQDTKRAL